MTFLSFLSGCDVGSKMNAFTVASGDTLTISAASGATITMAGDVTFAKTDADGPLITIDTDVSRHGCDVTNQDT